MRDMPALWTTSLTNVKKVGRINVMPKALPVVDTTGPICCYPVAAAPMSEYDGLELLENALVTGAGLVALILAFGPVSGAHFNPVVTLADRVFGGVGNGQVAAYLPAQLAGGVLGAVLANLMFGLDAVSISTHHRSSGGLWLSEALATF